MGSGLTINEQEIKKMVNNFLKEGAKKYRDAGNIAHREIREQATIKWFRSIGFSSGAKKILGSMTYRSNVKIKEHGVEIEFISYINPSKYDITGTSIYRQRDVYPIDHFSYIVEELQWNRGIYGLPDKSSQTDWVNRHFHQGEALESFTRRKFQYNWKKKINKLI